MRVIDIAELRTIEFSICKVASYLQRPSYRQLSIQSRIPNGFLHIERGECRYSSADGEFTLGPGSLVYLPFESQHYMEVMTEQIEFTRIDFTIRNSDGEILIFSTLPRLITVSTTDECRRKIAELSDIFRHSTDKLESKRLICSILSSLAAIDGETHADLHRQSRIAPAIRCIEENFCERITGEELAGLCYMSTVQMYRLFRAEVGCSPIVYRNRLRIDRACRLLRGELFAPEQPDGDSTLAEIAEMLGFESIYYFSRMFKQYVGMSPSEYRNSSRN